MVNLENLSINEILEIYDNEIIDDLLSKHNLNDEIENEDDIWIDLLKKDFNLDYSECENCFEWCYQDTPMNEYLYRFKISYILNILSRYQLVELADALSIYYDDETNVDTLQNLITNKINNNNIDNIDIYNDILDLYTDDNLRDIAINLNIDPYLYREELILEIIKFYVPSCTYYM